MKDSRNSSVNESDNLEKESELEDEQIQTNTSSYQINIKDEKIFWIIICQYYLFLHKYALNVINIQLGGMN